MGAFRLSISSLEERGTKKPASGKAGLENYPTNSALATNRRESDEAETEESDGGAAIWNSD